MSWDVIATIAEVISAVAVVVSLIYLAHQIRQGNVESQSSALYQFLDNQTGANLGIIDNADVAELIDRANKNMSELSDAEIIRLQFVFSNHFNQWLYAFKTRQKSLIDVDTWDGILRGYSLLMKSSPAFNAMWEYCGSVYPTDFIRHVQEIIVSVGIKNDP